MVTFKGGGHLRGNWTNKRQMRGRLFSVYFNVLDDENIIY